MKIIYIHHGNRKNGNPPSEHDDLTKLGYKDCKLVAKLFNRDKIKSHLKAIYTSPYFRCRITAEILNKKLNVKLIEDARLNEFNRDQEKWINLQKRVGACIDDITHHYNDDDIVICVTSGVNISAFINKAYGLPPSEKAPFLLIPSCSPIVFDYKTKEKK